MSYYVCRSYSHTDKRMLWKILSRPMADRHSAEVWLNYMKDSEGKQHEYFIVERLSNES